jgi:hypothetical protein
MVFNSIIIVVPKNASQQEEHKDVPMLVGPFKAACLGFSVNGQPLNTLFAQGSHIINHSEKSDYEIFSSSPIVQASWKGGVLYDMHTTHAGAENTNRKEKPYRIFIGFRGANISQKDLNLLRNDLHNKDNTRKHILLSEFLPKNSLTN